MGQSAASPAWGMTLALIGLCSTAPALAGDWHFKVTNATRSRIIRLETREKGGAWGYFNLGGGIKPGETTRLEWDQSTNTQDCIQFIRAKFADGSTSEPAQFDFCDDLDTPIEFSE